MPRRLLLSLLVIAAAASHRLHAQGAVVMTSAQRDSAFRAQVRATLIGAGVGDPRGLLLFEGLRASGELQVRVLEGELPDSALMQVYRVVRFRPDSWPGDALRLLVRVDADAFQGEPNIGLDGLPELENLADVARAISTFADARPGLGAAGQTFRAQVETVVSRSGAVVFAMLRETSGNADVDRFAAETVMTMRFRPARTGAIPVDAWVTLPIAVTVPAR